MSNPSSPTLLKEIDCKNPRGVTPTVIEVGHTETPTHQYLLGAKVFARTVVAGAVSQGFGPDPKRST
jgi:hypothetical protein